MAKQTICLVGRPNTGKSTLFNRIVGKKVAIIEDSPGVTRDRIYSQAVFNEIPFYLIDTGGIDLSDGDFNEEIRMQVEIGIEESDTIIFVVDAKESSKWFYERYGFKKVFDKVSILCKIHPKAQTSLFSL